MWHIVWAATSATRKIVAPLSQADIGEAVLDVHSCSGKDV